MDPGSRFWPLIIALGTILFACKESGSNTTGQSGAMATDVARPESAECPVSTVVQPVRECARETACKSSDACGTAIVALSDLVRACLANLHLPCALVELDLDNQGCPVRRNILASIGQTQAFATCVEPKIKAVSWPCAKGRRIVAGVACSN